MPKTKRLLSLVILARLVFMGQAYSVLAAPPEVGPEPENCRLFGVATLSPQTYQDYDDYLMKFQYPTQHQYSGWSLGFYSEYYAGGMLSIPGMPMVIRSHLPVIYDRAMFRSIHDLAIRMRPQVLLAHQRNASSGCVEVADPHPFMRSFNGKWYLFQHNGGVWGRDLEILINSLVANYATPENCPDTPIDSEYLFLFFLKIMAKTGWDEFNSLQLWAGILQRYLVNRNWNACNIIVTEGLNLWAVKLRRNQSGFELTYHRGPQARTYVVSTEALGEDWYPLFNDSVYYFKPGHEPLWRPIRAPLNSLIDLVVD